MTKRIPREAQWLKLLTQKIRYEFPHLSADVRAFMEPRFGQDFSRVRVHTDAPTAESARSVNALAYSVGDHIAFQSGVYNPATTAGRHLLAHELTHMVQGRKQGGRSAEPAQAISDPGDAASGKPTESRSGS